MSWTQTVKIAAKMGRLKLASRETMGDLRDVMRSLNEREDDAFAADITKTFTPISLNPVLQPYYDRFGEAMLALLWSRPLRCPQEEFDQLRHELVRLRTTMRIGKMSLASQIRLDGGGSTHAPLFVDYLTKRFPGRRFNTAMEWCCGPAFIGFSLLQAGLCERLVLVDINPDAIEKVRQTIARNGLEDRVTTYLSDNLDNVDPSEQCDLIVGNPPWSFSRNNLYNELIANDPGWDIHRRFYASVDRFVKPGGILCISEFKPHDAVARMEPNTKEIWDTRPRVPHDEFLEMIESGGLRHLETIAPDGRDKTAFGFGVWFVVSTKDDVKRRPAREQPRLTQSTTQGNRI